MLVRLEDIIKDADKGKYAIGAFNIFNLESAQAVARAARDLRSPVIIQVSETTVSYAGLLAIAGIVKRVAETDARRVPVVLHLDHGRSFRSILECIKAGFSSVQIDASDLPLEDNITLTRSIVEFAHKRKVFVQGEIGHVPGIHGGKLDQSCDYAYTDLEEAKKFVRETNVDTLAIAIGTAHGLYKSQLDFKLLKQIKKATRLPLVLHGASGTSERDLKKAIRLGINEINIDTELRLTFIKAIKVFLKENPDETDPRDVMSVAREAIQKKVKVKIKIFGSEDQAN